MKIHFGYLMGLAALALAGCAAFFSVYGIGQLFAGATTAVIIMASSLEFSKLVAASYLQRYWNRIATTMKIYVSIGVFVLVCITSAGIYGFLSSAYQETFQKLTVNEAKISNITIKKERYEEELAAYTKEKEQLSESVNELSKGLANNVIQYKDKQTGNIITTTSSSTRKTLESQLKDVRAQRDLITPKMDVIRDSVTSYDLQILDLKVNNDISGELGPLTYISDLTGAPMDKVVNYFILLLIFVFDPLALTLVIATNWVFEQESKKRKDDSEEEETELPKDVKKYNEPTIITEVSNDAVNDATNDATNEVTFPLSTRGKIITVENKASFQPDEKVVEVVKTEPVTEPTPTPGKTDQAEVKATVTTNKTSLNPEEVTTIRNNANNARNFSRKIPARRGY